MSTLAEIHICCPACDTVFRMPDNEFRETGRELRCGLCNHEWLATKNDSKPIEKPLEETTKAPKTQKSFWGYASLSLLCLPLVAFILSYALQQKHPFSVTQQKNMLTITNNAATSKQLQHLYADTHQANILISREAIPLYLAFEARQTKTVTLQNSKGYSVQSGSMPYMILHGIWQSLKGKLHGK